MFPVFHLRGAVRCTGLLLIAVCVFTLSENSAWACPNCKFAIEGDAQLPQAYMVSILFMLGMIGAVVGSIVGLLWWMNRQEQAALVAAGYDHLFDNAASPAVPLPTSR